MFFHWLRKENRANMTYFQEGKIGARIGAKFGAFGSMD
jgi:hypothetical protein